MKIIAVGWNYRGHNAEMNQKEYEAYNFNGEAYEALLSEHLKIPSFFLNPKRLY